LKCQTEFGKVTSFLVSLLERITKHNAVQLGFITNQGQGLFSSSTCPEQPRHPRNLLFNGQWGLLLQA